MPLTRLTLLVPELLWPDPEDHELLEAIDCPALAALFMRGRFSRRPAQTLEGLLMESFGYAKGTACGAFRRRGESGAPADEATTRWLAADPVHLSFDGECLILTDGGALDIAPEEAAALVDALNTYFTDLGVFHAACGERWYLRLADGGDHGALARLDAPPVSAVAGRRVERTLLKILEDREILRPFNEIQTFLHAHPVNRRREDGGKAPINSLWLWGGGSLPPPPAATDFDAVLSADALTLGLARTAGLPTRPLFEDADALPFAADEVGARPLVVLDGLSGAIRRGDGADYRRILAALEKRWFAPVRRALTTGVVRSLRLVAPTAYGTLTWDAGRGAACPSWFSRTFRRRPRTFAETVRALAVHAGEAT
jgi:hypothetical protein